MQSSVQEEGGQPTTQIKASSIARQVLKHKGMTKAPKASIELQLEKIHGITSKGRNSFAYNPVTGDLAYPAGSIAVLYNPKSNKQTRHFFSSSRKSITALCFSPDGKYLAVASKGLEVSIWDLHSSNTQAAYVLKGHKYGIENILFSPNMKYFVSIGDGNDKGLFVWDWMTETILTKNKVSKKINAAVFSPSGQYLITAGEQHVKFWFFDALGNIQYAKPKDPAASTNASDVSVITTVSNVSTPSSVVSTPSGLGVNIIEGKGASLGKMAEKIFMDLACQNNQLFAITLDGVLCIINENTRAIEKWMDLKVPNGFSVLATQNYLICGCGDGFIRFFKISNMEHIFVLPKPPSLGSYNIEKGAAAKLSGKPNEKYADAIAVTYDEKNQKMATLYSDRTIFIWDLKNTDRIVVYRSFLNHSGSIYDIQLLPGMSSYEITFFATGSNDKTVRVWHLADSENKENEKVVKRNAYCKGLSRIIYINENFDHFKFQQSNENESYLLQDFQIRCVKSSQGGEFLATGDQVGYLRIFGANFELLQELKAHDQEILCLDFSPENEENVRFLATGSRDRLIHVYDLEKGFSIVTTIDDHSSSISSLRFSYDKSSKKLGLISCGADKTLIFRVYNPKLKTFEKTQTEVDKINKFYSLELNQEGTQAVAGQDKKISIWQIDTGKQKCVYETKDEDINAKNTFLDNLKVVVDLTGSYIAISNKDGTVRIRDYYTGNLLAKANCGDLSTGMCFTQNSKNLITTTADGCILTWNLPEEMVNSMNRKKAQLGINVKKLKEMLEINDNSLWKDFKYDSLLIEHELEEYVSKQNLQEKERIIDPDRLLAGLDEEGENTPQKGSKDVAEKENLEKMFNKSELPTWARTQAPVQKEAQKVEEKKEDKPAVSGKWLSRLENQSQIPGEGERKADIENKEEKKQVSPISKSESKIPASPLTKDVSSEHSKEQISKQSSAKQKTPASNDSDEEEEVAQIEKSNNQPNDKMEMSVASAEKEVEEDIQEDDYKESFEDLIEEDLEDGEKKNEEVGKKKGWVSPFKGVQEEKQKFIEQNFDKLDEEVLASPVRKSVEKSLSTVYLQSKSNTQEKRKEQEVDEEIQLKDENLDEEATESQGMIRYKPEGVKGRESLFDVNAIKNQVSNVSKTLENLESQLASKDNSKLPKHFQYFDQSRTFLSSFDISESVGGDFLGPIHAEKQTIAEQLINNDQPKKDKSSPVQVSRTPDREKKDTDSAQNLTPNTSQGVIRIDKRNLVPTTLEKLSKKHEASGGSKEEVEKRDEETEEKPRELLIKSENYGFSPEKFTLQPSTKQVMEGTLQKEDEVEEQGKNFPSPFINDRSRLKVGNDWEKEQGLSFNTSSFQKSASPEERMESELEESFSIIRNHLGKINAIMQNCSSVKNSKIKEKLTERFEQGFDETRRSIDMLGAKSIRSSTSQLDISQSMSELVIANSKDLLENYSKMLLKTFEKQLEEKLGKK